MSRLRLDQALTERGLVPSRARAQDFIRQGLVTVSGAVVTKSGRMVDAEEVIVLSPSAHAFVSRGALKLEAALDAFGLSPAGRAALDLGASTGGFTQVLLARGALRVYAVDVGREQLHASLREHPRVISLEQRDARHLTPAEVPDLVGAVTADLSFISLTLVLPRALQLTRAGAWLVALVKPQFEAGRAAIGKGGIVRDQAARELALARVQACVADLPGWTLVGAMPSPIAGQDGNAEWLLAARRAN
jgi:23S rRNA (cytidine1920-2'-O)/16S rRNA (cytidine1409-2'-O)-methyltransferase